MASSLDTLIESDWFGGSRFWSFISTSTAIHQFTRWLGRRKTPATQRAKQAEELSFYVLLTTVAVGAAMGLVCVGTIWLMGN